MKILALIFVLCTISNKALADKIEIVKGYGDTREKAIIDAKKIAVQRATGEFISSKSEISDDFLSTKTLSVTNGIVIEYIILEEYDGLSIRIQAKVSEDQYSGVIDDKNKFVIKKEVTQDLYEKDKMEMKALYDLFSNSSEIYDIIIDDVKHEVVSGKYCYDLDLSIKRNKQWEFKYRLLTKKMGKVFRREFDHKDNQMTTFRGSDQYMKPRVLVHWAKIVDKNNDISLHLPNSDNGVYFYLGENTHDFNKIYRICGPNKYESFDFKFIITKDIMRQRY